MTSGLPSWRRAARSAACRERPCLVNSSTVISTRWPTSSARSRSASSLRNKRRNARRTAWSDILNVKISRSALDCQRGEIPPRLRASVAKLFAIFVVLRVLRNRRTPLQITDASVPQANASSFVEPLRRVVSIDVLRGLVMVLMAIDHVRVFRCASRWTDGGRVLHSLGDALLCAGVRVSGWNVGVSLRSQSWRRARALGFCSPVAPFSCCSR